eukprot:2095509-Pleurochrysis_carterae.AAC.2
MPQLKRRLRTHCVCSVKRSAHAKASAAAHPAIRKAAWASDHIGVASLVSRKHCSRMRTLPASESLRP